VARYNAMVSKNIDNKKPTNEITATSKFFK